LSRRLAPAVNDQDVDGEGGALLFVELARDREVVDDVVLAVERQEEGALRLAVVGVRARVEVFAARLLRHRRADD
jgi:hypothetical protein